MQEKYSYNYSMKNVMRREYDFAKADKNPYQDKNTVQLTISLNVDTLKYFKELSAKIGLPYQTIINSYLTDCAMRQIEPKLKWPS